MNIIQQAVPSSGANMCYGQHYPVVLYDRGYGFGQLIGSKLLEDNFKK